MKKPFDKQEDTFIIQQKPMKIHNAQSTVHHIGADTGSLQHANLVIRRRSGD